MVTWFKSLIAHHFLLIYHNIFFWQIYTWFWFFLDEPMAGTFYSQAQKLLIIQNALETFKFPPRLSQTEAVAGGIF